MFKVYAVFLLALISVEVSSAYKPQIERTMLAINSSLESWADLFERNYFDLTQVASQPDQTGLIASMNGNAEFTDYIIEVKANYSSVAEAALVIANFTRELVAANIRSMKGVAQSRVAIVDSNSAELSRLLKKRGCSTQAIENYFDELFYAIEHQVVGNINEASDPYAQILYENFMPLYLVNVFFGRINNCNYQTDPVNCLKRIEDYYESFSIPMLKESAALMESYLINFNYRISRYLIIDTDEKLLYAHKTLYGYNCTV